MGRQHRRRARPERSQGSSKKLIEALQWQHRWGAQLDKWQKALDEGGSPPSTFFSRPEIDIDLQPIWSAFFHLSTDRQLGMGIGPIPRSKIIEYATGELGCGEDATDQFYFVIRKMDDEYVRLNSSKTDRPLNEVAPDDAEGVKSLFQSLNQGRTQQ